MTFVSHLIKSSVWLIVHPFDLLLERLKIPMVSYSVMPFLKEHLIRRKSSPQSHFLVIKDHNRQTEEIPQELKTHLYFILINKRPTDELFQLVDLATEHFHIPQSPLGQRFIFEFNQNL